MLGKSIYIWVIEACFASERFKTVGDRIARIVAAIVAAGFESVILHSTNVWNWATPERMALAAALKAAGVRVFGGAAVYGQYAADEGATAANIVVANELDGFVFDAESAFDKIANPGTQAANLLRSYRSRGAELRKDKPNAPRLIAGWCWWAFWHARGNVNTFLHPKGILWAAMARGYGDADFGCPMDYWSEIDVTDGFGGDSPQNAVKYLDESWAQWRAITDKPICPLGRTYVGDAGITIPTAVVAFEAEARRLGAPGVGWWSLQHALDAVKLPGVWDALVELPGFKEPEYHQYAPVVASGATFGSVGGPGGQVDFSHPLK